MTHTKGIWKSTGVAVQDASDPVFYHTDIICNDTIRVAKSSGVGKELALANARLIAAAPELLAACKRAKSRLEQCQQILNKYGDKYSAHKTDNFLAYGQLEAAIKTVEN